MKTSAANTPLRGAHRATCSAELHVAECAPVELATTEVGTLRIDRRERLALLITLSEQDLSRAHRGPRLRLCLLVSLAENCITPSSSLE